jgi:hypothetical protein
VRQFESASSFDRRAEADRNRVGLEHHSAHDRQDALRASRVERVTRPQHREADAPEYELQGRQLDETVLRKVVVTKFEVGASERYF